mmetsp:Transcript_11824/g.28302  ORF Transcript_11824/g.28302 Transcript_11824/m.28302 type:complete len:422 (-) Transcript_11824:550-1815(-)
MRDGPRLEGVEDGLVRYRRVRREVEGCVRRRILYCLHMLQELRVMAGLTEWARAVHEREVGVLALIRLDAWHVPLLAHFHPNMHANIALAALGKKELAHLRDGAQAAQTALHQLGLHRGVTRDGVRGDHVERATLIVFCHGVPLPRTLRSHLIEPAPELWWEDAGLKHTDGEDRVVRLEELMKFGLRVNVRLPHDQQLPPRRTRKCVRGAVRAQPIRQAMHRAHGDVLLLLLEHLVVHLHQHTHVGQLVQGGDGRPLERAIRVELQRLLVSQENLFGILQYLLKEGRPADALQVALHATGGRLLRQLPCGRTQPRGVPRVEEPFGGGALVEDVVDAREPALAVRLVRVRHQPEVQAALGQVELLDQAEVQVRVVVPVALHPLIIPCDGSQVLAPQQDDAVEVPRVLVRRPVAAPSVELSRA